MKNVRIKFADDKVAADFGRLSCENKDMYRWIINAFKKIEENIFYGIQIKKKLIPKEYINKYHIDNLWKINLPQGYRLIYSIGRNEIVIICVIIEWFNHKEYNRRFKY